jgi:hypothetical protein
MDFGYGSGPRFVNVGTEILASIKRMSRYVTARRRAIIYLAGVKLLPEESCATLSE